jgi:pyruvate-formate lyase-activating enzyme
MKLKIKIMQRLEAEIGTHNFIESRTQISHTKLIHCRLAAEIDLIMQDVKQFFY